MHYNTVHWNFYITVNCNATGAPVGIAYQCLIHFTMSAAKVLMRYVHYSKEKHTAQ